MKEGISSLKDKVFDLIQDKVKDLHLILILTFTISALLFSILAYFNWLGLGSISSGLAIAFATATVVDFAYNYVVMKDISEMVAGHLMLKREVQLEIMKPDKIKEILSIALDSLVGPKLSEALRESIIYEIAVAKDLFLMESAYFGVVLKNSENPVLKNDFFDLTITSRFNMTVEGNKATFYATNSNEIIDKLIKNYPKTYFVYKLPNLNTLPNSDTKILEENFAISELMMNDIIIKDSKTEYPKMGNGNDFIIKVDFEIPNNICARNGEMVKIKFKLNSIIHKYKHYFYRTIPRAYPSFHLMWDCADTNIERVDVLCSCLGTQPEIIRHLANGKKVDIIIDNWVLPNNMIVFIWKLAKEGECK